MASWQSRVARLIVRVTVRRRLQRHQTSLEDQYQTMRRTLALGDVRNARLPKDITILPATLGEWVIPRGASLEGEYAGAPPILLFASTIEMLRDDSTRLAEKLRGTGVDVRLNLVADMPHCWPIFPSLPEAAAAQREMSHFARHVWLEPDRPLPDAVGI